MAKSSCVHHFIIDAFNIGRCKYCPEVRDFGVLQQRVEWLKTAKSGKGGKKNRGKKRRRRKELIYV